MTCKDMNRLPGSGKSKVTGPASKSKHPGRIKRIAVEPDHGLVVDRGRLAAVQELTQPALLDYCRQVDIAFSSARENWSTGAHRHRGR